MQGKFKVQRSPLNNDGFDLTFRIVALDDDLREKAVSTLDPDERTALLENIAGLPVREG
ncbi:hypothetical protein JANAI61_37220 [Jannaschia sp. AI_61]|nr:hypothetical protein JANAI61_37220 [Jannaschia sp. AI_61]